MRLTPRVILFFIITSLLITATVIILNLLGLRQSEADNKQVLRTYESMNASKDLLSTLLNAETGLTGYLFTHEKKFLQPYEGTPARTNELIALLKKTVTDPEQQYRLDTLN